MHTTVPLDSVEIVEAVQVVPRERVQNRNQRKEKKEIITREQKNTVKKKESRIKRTNTNTTNNHNYPQQ